MLFFITYAFVVFRLTETSKTWKFIHVALRMLLFAKQSKLKVSIAICVDFFMSGKFLTFPLHRLLVCKLVNLIYITEKNSF